MPGTQDDRYNPFIGIVGGKIVQTVSEDTPGARKREWEAGGRTGVKYELVYKSWKGRIEKIVIRDTEFGEMCNVYFSDATLSLNTASRYFTDFAKKIMSADVNQEVEIAPYDFEDDKQVRRTGVSILQNGKKLENKFWDVEKKAPKNGFPIPEGDTKTYKTDDWKVYYIGVKKFLVAQLETLEFPENKEEEITHQALVDTGLVDTGTEFSDVELGKVPF